MPSTATSAAEVTNISKHGFWMLIDGRDLFLPFDEFPWGRECSVCVKTETERGSPAARA